MKPQQFKWSMMLLLVLVLALAACGGTPAKPTVTLQATNVNTVMENQDLTVQATAVDEKGIARIELSVDNGVVAVASINPPQKSVTAPLSWKAVGGQHTVSARALDVDNLLSEPAVMPVTIAFAPAPQPTAQPQPAPTQAAPTVAPTAGPAPTSAAACVNNVTFVADVTFPDGATVVPNQAFNKTWRIRNTGTCAWGSGYQIVRTAGEKMSGADAYALSAAAPGATVDVTVAMNAPAAAGAHESRWQMRDASGNGFGWLLVKVTTVIPAPPSAAIVSPGNGFSFVSGTTIKITYSGASNYTEVSSIALYANGQLLAKTPARTPSRQLTASFDWKPGAGNYDLYVVATDIAGAQTTSAHIGGAITQPQPTCQLAANFRADRTSIIAGEHTYLRWDVECANAVYLDGQGVTGHQVREVAPGSTTTYTLRAIRRDGSPADFHVTINVGSAPQPTAVPQPTRRNVSGSWDAGDWDVELSEALGCGGPECGVAGRLMHAMMPSPEIFDVQGTINVNTGAINFSVTMPGGRTFSGTVSADSRTMSGTLSGVGGLTFHKQ